MKNANHKGTHTQKVIEKINLNTYIVFLWLPNYMSPIFNWYTLPILKGVNKYNSLFLSNSYLL